LIRNFYTGFMNAPILSEKKFTYGVQNGILFFFMKQTLVLLQNAKMKKMFLWIIWPFMTILTLLRFFWDFLKEIRSRLTHYVFSLCDPHWFTNFPCFFYFLQKMLPLVNGKGPIEFLLVPNFLTPGFLVPKAFLDCINLDFCM
jgi:hypothetical protein